MHHINGSRPTGNAWAAALAILALAAPVGAQEHDARGWREAAFTTGASFGDGGAALALTAALAFRVTSRASVEFEALYARKLDFTVDLCPPPRVCVIGGTLPAIGRSVSLVPAVVIDVLPRSRRLRAYVQAGAGAGHVRQRYWFPAPPRVNPDATEFTRSSLVPAVAYGGGIAVRVSPRLGLGADVRLLHLLDDRGGDRSITPAGALTSVRVGSRLSWLF